MVSLCNNATNEKKDYAYFILFYSENNALNNLCLWNPPCVTHVDPAVVTDNEGKTRGSLHPPAYLLALTQCDNWRLG